MQSFYFLLHTYLRKMQSLSTQNTFLKLTMQILRAQKRQCACINTTWYIYILEAKQRQPNSLDRVSATIKIDSDSGIEVSALIL